MKYTEVRSGDAVLTEELSRLASHIVKEHYDPILGPAQNDYMIEKFQSARGISEQLAHGYRYYIVAEDTGEPAGFIAFYRRESDVYLSKFYLKKEKRGLGISHDMLDFVKKYAEQCGVNSIVLNVNKYNDAVFAYRKLGFVKIGEEVNDIGCGYVMDDYVLRYSF